MLIIVTILISSALLVEIVALVFLSHSVSSFRKFWAEQNNTSRGEVLYVALGDSAAQGIGATSPARGYVSLLAEELAIKNRQTVQVTNLSVSGAKIQDVTKNQLPQIKKLTLKKNTVVTLEIGANEMRAFNEQTFRADMNTLLKQMPDQTIVAEVPYFGGGRFRKYEKNVLIANDIIHELADSYGLRVAPLYEITKTRDSLLVYAADLFHPSNTGYKNWLEAFRQAMGQ